MKVLSTIFLALVTILLAACVSHPNQPPEALLAEIGKVQYGVTLQPSGNELKIKTPAKGWKSKDRKNGYVGFDVGQSGLLTFGIKNEDIDESCKPPNGSGVADWVITKIELSATGNPVTEKGTDFGKDQSSYPWLKEAFPAVELTDGLIFNAPTLADGRTSVTIYSANQQKGETLTYYLVTATRCLNGDTVKSDPGIRNGGRR